MGGEILTHIAERKGDICATRIVFCWIYILCLGFRSEAAQGRVDTVSLGSVRELREEVGKDNEGCDEEEGQSKTLIWTGWGHTEWMRAKQTPRGTAQSVCGCTHGFERVARSGR